MPERSRLRLRRRAGEAVLAVFFALAPSEVPAWRTDPGVRPAVVLSVGDPVTPLVGRARLRPRAAPGR
jgi:hypothetical protein